MDGTGNQDQSFDTWTKGWNEDGTKRKNTQRGVLSGFYKRIYAA